MSAGSTAGSRTGTPAGMGLAALLLSMADDEFVIGFSDSEWTGIAPILEEDVAMSSLAQDEIGHAAALYGLYGDVTGADPDATAYDREPEAYRHARLLDHGRGDWAMTIARRYLYESADAVRLEALAGASWTPTRRPRRQAPSRGALPPDARGRLDRPARAGRRRAARSPGAAFETLGPDAATVFTPLPDEPALVMAGILAAPMRELELRWRDLVAPVLDGRRLPALPAGPAATDGRTGHGDAFRWLWGEFTSVRHSDPAAVW